MFLQSPQQLALQLAQHLGRLLPLMQIGRQRHLHPYRFAHMLYLYWPLVDAAHPLQQHLATLAKLAQQLMGWIGQHIGAAV